MGFKLTGGMFCTVSTYICTVWWKHFMNKVLAKNGEIKTVWVKILNVKDRSPILKGKLCNKFIQDKDCKISKSIYLISRVSFAKVIFLQTYKPFFKQILPFQVIKDGILLQYCAFFLEHYCTYLFKSQTTNSTLLWHCTVPTVHVTVSLQSTKMQELRKKWR